MAGALQRFRVIELGHYIVGPVLGMLLADQGAEVIKIEPPSGDPFRGHPAFAVWGRGKKSVVLDMARRQDQRIAQELVATADVLIESFSPGTMHGLGLSFHQAQQLNGGIIYVSLPGFPPGHPNEDVAARESIVSAFTGLYADRSADGSDGPTFIAVPYASIFGAMVAAPAIAAALLHRDRTGEGQLVQVPVYDAMFTAMGSNLVRRHDSDQKAIQVVSPVIGRFYQCRDGRWVNINAGYPRALKPLLEAVGHPDWYEPITDRKTLANDADERQLWTQRFTAMWRERTALEWEELMASAGMPCTMCRTIEEWMETAHAWESGAVIEVDDPTYGPMRQVGIPVRLRETPGEVRGPAPTLGQHTESVIAGLGGPLSNLPRPSWEGQGNDKVPYIPER